MAIGTAYMTGSITYFPDSKLSKCVSQCGRARQKNTMSWLYVYACNMQVAKQQERNKEIIY